MRYTLIALAIAGCGGHSKATDGDAAVSEVLTLDEIARACVNGYGCLEPPIDGPTMQTCLSHLDDIDTIVSIYRPAQIRCLAKAGADCVAAPACVGYSYAACSPSAGIATATG